MKWRDREVFLSKEKVDGIGPGVVKLPGVEGGAGLIEDMVAVGEGLIGRVGWVKKK